MQILSDIKVGTLIRWWGDLSKDDDVGIVVVSNVGWIEIDWCSESTTRHNHEDMSSDIHDGQIEVLSENR